MLAALNLTCGTAAGTVVTQEYALPLGSLPGVQYVAGAAEAVPPLLPHQPVAGILPAVLLAYELAAANNWFEALFRAVSRREA